MPIRILSIIICLISPPAWAAWTGIAAFVGESETDWSVNSSRMQADYGFFGFRIEEKTEADLRIGATAGQFSIRLSDHENIFPTEEFDGEFLSFYLRWPFALSENLKLHSRLNYQFHNGDWSNDSMTSKIDWTEASLRLGVSLQMGRLSLRPYMEFRSINGDINSENNVRSFDQYDNQSSGLILDYRVENNAYVRLQTTLDNRHSIYLGFVREY